MRSEEQNQLLCHCERSEAIHFTACTALNHGLPRRYAPRNDLHLIDSGACNKRRRTLALALQPRRK